MKKATFILLVLVLMGYLGYVIYDTQNELEDNIHHEIKVLLVYNKDKNSDVLKAYESVLEEEGVPFDVISNQELIKLPPDKTYINVPAIIFPDSVNQYIENGTEYWIGRYVKSGGKVALVYDVDTKRKDGKYKLSSTYLDRITGLCFAVYQREKDKSYRSGYIHFKDESSARYFEFPSGKLDENLTIVGYKYGKLLYPVSAVKVINEKDQKIYAWDDKQQPAIIRKDLEKGSLLYINAPLGYLKGNSDDLFLRSVLRTFLFKIANVPHIISSPNAKGTLVLNWHIDSSIEYISLPWNFEHHYLRKDFNQSFHITAGPDLYKPYDGLGFDATGKGRELVKKMMQYGPIGSHGGWIHNWFAQNIEEKKFGKKEMKEYIQKNNEALESIIGYKPVEYSAPNGVFPPLPSIEIMKELGFQSYYYVGDGGSAPNRTFYNGKMLSDKIIAFPVMTFGINASIKEFSNSHWSEEKVKKYYKEFIDYLIDNHTVRLFYSHPYDIPEYNYKSAMMFFLDYTAKLVQEGKLQTRTLTNIADFTMRVIDTKKRFWVDVQGVHAKISNHRSLKEMVLAIPKKTGEKKIVRGNYSEDKNYYYIPLDNYDNEALIDLSFQ